MESTAPPTPAIRHRFHLLDALRGIAALLVVVVHAPAYVQLRFRPQNDFLAVDFFFCLSGFVIAHSYEKRLQDQMTLWAFVRARLIRLYPLYLLGTMCGVAWASWMDRHSIGYGLLKLISLGLLLLPNLSTATSPMMFPLDLPGWSLFWEIGVNVMLAALIRLRVAKNWLLIAGMTVCLFAVGHWLQKGNLFGELGWRSRPDLLGFDFARVMLSFIGGFLLYRLYRKQTRVVHSLLSSSMLGLATAFCLVFLLRAPLPGMGGPVFQLCCVAVLFPFLVFCGAHCRLPHKLDRGCAVLGEVSYPLYLLHAPLLRVLDTRHASAYASTHPNAVLIVFPFAVGAILLVSYVTSRVYDIPLRNRLVGRKKKEQRKLITA